MFLTFRSLSPNKYVKKDNQKEMQCDPDIVRVLHIKRDFRQFSAIWI